MRFAAAILIDHHPLIYLRHGSGVFFNTVNDQTFGCFDTKFFAAVKEVDQGSGVFNVFSRNFDNSVENDAHVTLLLSFCGCSLACLPLPNRFRL